MRRNASMSGSTSTKSSSKPRGLTVPSLSARLLPWVRVTVFSRGRAMASSSSAALALDAVGHGERAFHPGGRQVLPRDGGERLEDLEMMAQPLGGAELDHRLARRAAGKRRLDLRDRDRVVAIERETLAGPRFHPRAGLEEFRPLAKGIEERLAGHAGLAPRGRLQPGPVAREVHGEFYFQGMREAWITSGTPWPPTERMARSTSYSPNACVVIFSRGNRLEASCCRASSQAL